MARTSQPGRKAWFKSSCLRVRSGSGSPPRSPQALFQQSFKPQGERKERKNAKSQRSASRRSAAGTEAELPLRARAGWPSTRPESRPPVEPGAPLAAFSSLPRGIVHSLPARSAGRGHIALSTARRPIAACGAYWEPAWNSIGPIAPYAPRARHRCASPSISVRWRDGISRLTEAA
jgi:hypothetical protein